MELRLQMTKQLKFQTVDVFTDHVFGGNPLAVFTDARDIGDADLQKIAAEMNYSETTFILPPDDPRNAARVRIFTPRSEMPFAGHPNVGTGYLLASQPDLIPGSTNGDHLNFEEVAGLVKVHPNLTRDGLIESISITAPQSVTIDQTLPAELIAASLNLELQTIETSRTEPIVAGTGVLFAIAEVNSREALAACVVNNAHFANLDANYGYEGDFFSLLVFFEADDGVLHARMFAPLGGIPEDPATGSAATALGALLAELDPATDKQFSFTIHQGDDMGRPSRLHVEVTKAAGKTAPPILTGSCIPVITGVFAL
jgi:trans-2,3-dihydro-3-hydroxyanthranilate isomerase